MMQMNRLVTELKMKKSVAVATDLGVYDDYTVEHLSDLNAVVLEANHDIHMLEVGPYPYPLKRRVMGDGDIFPMNCLESFFAIYYMMTCNM